MTIGRFKSLALSLAVLTACHLDNACAHQQELRPGDEVVAESQFGNGFVAGPVRTGRNGLEVRLPGGTWVECANNCSETLRLETVDFWEAQNRTTNCCGLLGCLELRYPSR